MAAAGSSAAVPFWRAAGMTYISYSNICASLVRSCLKEPYKSEAAAREKVHFAVSKWVDGKPEKPGTLPFLLLYFDSVSMIRMHHSN
ncbi:ATP synthase subunit epsilon, mitochondrial [Apostasia shenzhenica]|uniref:ATP synthase subunit epsilon, mitochondrial n=1 Tax=Apostasia shenzhenica TaxID=1088818 RepID=A0A2I0AB84_9ASPA|nr:ATP synthase subunit epsilon, mitochondrial [Apostasia shenzhenica]